MIRHWQRPSFYKPFVPAAADVFESIQVPWNKEGLSKDWMDKIPKMRITEENLLSNTNPCSICLEVLFFSFISYHFNSCFSWWLVSKFQDLLRWETVHRLPQCHHMFHVSCIRKWLMGQKSCPLCRRIFWLVSIQIFYMYPIFLFFFYI